MYVYDRNEHKLLVCNSVKIQEVESEMNVNSFEVVFTSSNGESIQRQCRGYYDATQYMDEVATAADAGSTLILVDNS